MTVIGPPRLQSHTAPPRDTLDRLSRAGFKLPAPTTQPRRPRCEPRSRLPGKRVSTDSDSRALFRNLVLVPRYPVASRSQEGIEKSENLHFPYGHP